MHEAAEISGPALFNRWTNEIQAGDRIVVRDSWYAHADLRNGQTGTVLAVDPEHGGLTFSRDLDGVMTEPPQHLGPP